MTRKRRVAKARMETLSPAWTFALLTGDPAVTRIRGWLAFENAAVRLPTGEYSWTAEGDSLWAQHREGLMAEAAAHGFEPYWLTKRDRPTGTGFDQWRATFLAQHRY